MKVWRYMELEKIQHLPNEGRVLLGHYIYWTEKRDGSCLAIWMKPITGLKTSLRKIFHKPIIRYLVVSSRNREKAEDSITRDFQYSKERQAILEYLIENPTHTVFGELLRKGLSPTRIENHIETEYIVFDIFDGNHFLNYQQIHQICFHYGMKCVQLFGEGRFTSMESLYNYRDEMLELCKKEHREGVVLKTLTAEGNPLYAKEKLDTAKSRGQPKLEKGRPVYPPLPLSEAMGAVDKAYADLGEKFSIKRDAMPVVATYIKKEMEKHMCSAPEYDFYRLYCDYCQDHHIEQKETNTIVKKIVEAEYKENRIVAFFRRLRNRK
jgi:hypothetical protein